MRNVGNVAGLALGLWAAGAAAQPWAAELIGDLVPGERPGTPYPVDDDPIFVHGDQAFVRRARDLPEVFGLAIDLVRIDAAGRMKGVARTSFIQRLPDYTSFTNFGTFDGGVFAIGLPTPRTEGAFWFDGGATHWWPLYGTADLCFSSGPLRAQSSPNGVIAIASPYFPCGWPFFTDLFASRGPGDFRRLTTLSGDTPDLRAGFRPVGETSVLAYFDVKTTVPDAGGVWVTDGTGPGTRQILATADGGELGVGSSAASGTSLFFTADGGLWRHDEALGGSTTLPMACHSAADLRAWRGDVYLTCEDAGVRGLWRVDALSGEVIPVAHPLPGGANGPRRLTAADAGLYFVAASASLGDELFVLTSTGTQLSLDIKPGASGSSPDELTASGDALFFFADDGSHGRELWRLAPDGDAGLVADLDAAVGASLSYLHAFDGGVLFVRTLANRQQELWRSDGTTAGTLAVLDLDVAFGGSNPRSFQKAGAAVVFLANPPDAGPLLFGQEGPGAPVVVVETSPGADHVAVGDEVVFTRTDGDAGRELWTTRGSAATTRLLRDVNAGPASSDPSAFLPRGGALYFSAFEPSVGREAFRLSLNTGALEVADLVPGDAGSSPFAFYPHANGVLVSAAGSDGGRRLHLWNPPNPSIEIEAFQVPESLISRLVHSADGEAFVIAATDGGRRLWRVGANGMVDSVPAPGAASAHLEIAGKAGDRIVLVETELQAFPRIQGQWAVSWDGGVERVGDPLRHRLSSPLRWRFAAFEVGSRLVWTTTEPTGDAGWELIVSDGTAAGTKPLDLTPGPHSALPVPLGRLSSGELLIASRALDSSLQLLASDGTIAGTRIFSAPLPTTGGVFPHTSVVEVCEDSACLGYDDGESGKEPWIIGPPRVADAGVDSGVGDAGSDSGTEAGVDAGSGHELDGGEVVDAGSNADAGSEPAPIGSAGCGCTSGSTPALLLFALLGLRRRRHRSLNICPKERRRPAPSSPMPAPSLQPRGSQSWRTASTR